MQRVAQRIWTVVDGDYCGDCDRLKNPELIHAYCSLHRTMLFVDTRNQRWRRCEMCHRAASEAFDKAGG
jgi:hypothetical protein